MDKLSLHDRLSMALNSAACGKFDPTADYLIGILADVRELESVLHGCLHFDDGFVSHGIIGDELRKWRYSARKILTKTGAIKGDV